MTTTSKGKGKDMPNLKGTKRVGKAGDRGDSNAKGVMVFTDLGKGSALYYLRADQLAPFLMDEGTPGYGEGEALVKRGVILSAVSTTDVPVGSFSTLVNIAALKPLK